MILVSSEHLAKRFPDAYWQAAAAAALAAAEEADRVLVPQEFLGLDPRFAPLEYSWGLEGTERLAWCCVKDDVDRLAPWHVPRGTDAGWYTWANEVFVVGANFRWRRRADFETRRHLAAWFERVEEYRRGVSRRPPKARVAHAVPGAPRVLVVGASAMGNVGDDLLAEVLTELLSNLGVEVHLCGPDIDPRTVVGYAAVIVGGGGLLYASRNGANETQNLANYLKFGAIGREFGVPVALIGVGEQDHARGMTRDPLTRQFVARTLRAFRPVTARDPDTAALVLSLGDRFAEAGTDLLFHWADRARRAVKPTAAAPGRVAWAGELYRYRTIADGLAPQGTLAASIAEGDFDLLVMSNDDVEHAERAREAMTAAGASVSIVDLRNRDFESLVFLFASYSCVITTRFHGLVLSMLAGVPVLAFDKAVGKSARLLDTIDAGPSLVTDDDRDATARLAAALTGGHDAIALERVDELQKQTAVHREALQALVGPVGRPSARPAAAAPLATVVRLTRSKSPWPDDESSIPLCWAASNRDTGGYANLGDSLSAVMVAALSGRAVRHTSFDAERAKLVAVGSIGHAIRGGTALVWGAGVSIRGGTLAGNVRRTRYDVRAMRGPISAQHYRDFGIDVPDVYGDPVWLLPSIRHAPVEKRYELGVIPHIRDVAGHHPGAPARPDSLRYVVDDADAGSVVVLNTWHEPTWAGLLAKIDMIRSCKRILSQSFHGLVIAEAYGIPALNFRHLAGAKNGLVEIDLHEPCTTDPRVWEFYAGGTRPNFPMWSQPRSARTDWDAAIRAIDERWAPFELDAAPLVGAFPLPLAYDPLGGRLDDYDHLRALSF